MQRSLWVLRRSCQRHSRYIRADPPQRQRVRLGRPSAARADGRTSGDAVPAQADHAFELETARSGYWPSEQAPSRGGARPGRGPATARRKYARFGEASPELVGRHIRRQAEARRGPRWAGAIDVASLPFQIPLGALLPVRMENLSRRARTSARRTSPTAATGGTRSSGTSARLRARLSRSRTRSASGRMP